MIVDFLPFIALGILGLSFIILMWYYLGSFSVFNKATEPIRTLPDSEPVSIIVCARNERKFLEEHLPHLLSLDYPNYEVILMNDCSWDGSKEMLEEMEKKYERLKVHNLEEENLYQHDKKFPLTLGIKAAKSEIVLLTDADCVPKSKQWIQEILAGYSRPGIEIVIGYGAYLKKEGMLNKLIRFDTFTIALQYFASSLKGRSYMATGRNLSYKKTLFFRNKGFASHNHIRSGDDDLFVNRVSNGQNTTVQFSHGSHTVSVPKETYGDWINQKRRHVTTAIHYRSGDKLYLALYPIAQFVFFVGFICSLVFAFQWFYIPVSIFLLKYIVQFVIFKKAMEKLDEKDLLILMPVLEILLLFFYFSVHIANLFTRQPKWK